MNKLIFLGLFGGAIAAIVWLASEERNAERLDHHVQRTQGAFVASAQTTSAPAPSAPEQQDESISAKEVADRAAAEAMRRARSGKWTVSKDISPIDDSQSVYLHLVANEPINARLTFKRVYPSLMIRCVENTTSLIINWNVYLGIDDQPITYRIDKEPAETRRWGISTNYETLGLWRGNTSIPLIRRLIGKETLFATVTPYGDSPKQAFFDIAGLDVAIEPLREACNW